MPHLLHIDSSINGDQSVSRRLTARAVAAWKAAHHDGTVTYRDLGAAPVPHLTAETAATPMVPEPQRNPAQAANWALRQELIDEIRAADTIIVGFGLYNFGAPSSLKAWVDHVITYGLSVDPESKQGLLGGRELIMLEARGGGYGEGTPREGWDHAEQWLPHGLAMTGLEPRIIVVELTFALVLPELAHLKPLHEESMAGAERQIDALWAGVTA